MTFIQEILIMTFIYSSERTKSANLFESVNKTNLGNKINLAQACLPREGRERLGYLEQGEGQDRQELRIIFFL